MIRLLFVATLTGSLALAAPAHADDARYRTPPPEIASILTAPRLPRTAPDLSPDGAHLLQPDLRALIGIETLAEPVERIAGLEVIPRFGITRQALKNAASGLTFVRVSDARQTRAQLPAEARIIATAWSTRGDKLACALVAEGGCALWVVEVGSGEARRVDGVRLHGVPRVSLEFALDDKAIFAAIVPATLPAASSAAARVSEGPAVRASAGRAAPQRTSRDVLRTAADQQTFERHTLAQLARVPLSGAAPQPIGAPAAIQRWSVSPDEKVVLVERVSATPLGFPAMLFPRRIELWSTEDRAPVVIGDAPLDDRSTIASVAPLGPRVLRFAPDGRALLWAEWQDTPGASPLAAVRDTALPVPGRDRLRWLEAPFTGAPRELTTCEWRVDDLLFAPDGRVLVQESYEPRRAARQWWFAPSAPAERHALVLRSTEGVYDEPGEPMTRRQRHASVLITTADGRAFYRNGRGFHARGQQPFVDRCGFDGRARDRVFESAATHLEQVTHLLAADGRRFLTLRQSATEPPNHFLRRSGESHGLALTAFTDPAPALSAAQRMAFTFTREDGVKLNAEALLPADWKPGTRLPTVFWIYPNDFRSAAAASENRTSPQRFASQSPLNPEVLVTQGYAVVRPDLAIVGSNDQFVAELQKSAKAAVEECVRRGFADRDRIGVGGHSYGAFAAANCLAHTRLFRAAVASDGAYNRTLTPFTFQAETRSLWDAKDTYLAMSPFLHADRIEAPILLLHNQDDTNVGTHPMQSDRLFEALNGLGRTTQLIQYPFEDHAPAARETVLDYWARATEWLDRYVKSPPAARVAEGPSGAERP